MSLQVWLPLNGDLHNQGLSNITVTNNGATINNNGKIGKCYSFDGSNSCIELNAPSLYNVIKGGNQSFTIMFWIYHAAASRGIIFGDYGLTGTIQCNVELQSNHKVRFYWAGAPDKNFSTSVGENTWCHIALVYDGSQVIIYKNGVLQTGDSYSGTLTAKSKTTGVYHLGRDYRNDTNLNGKLNDFRIYDHALSAKEVEEIAKGLVLHYKLDNNGLGNPNLIANSKQGGSWGYASSGYDRYAPTTLVVPDKDVYTLSFEAKSTVNGDKMRTHYYYPNTTTTCVSSQGITKTASDGHMDFTLTTTWTRYWVTYYQSATTTVKRLICPRLIEGQGTGTVSVRNVKFEEGSVATPWIPATSDAIYSQFIGDTNTIYDSSGYSNNGTIVGPLTTSTPSPRYGCATKFDGNTSCIKIPYNEINPDRIFTVNLWFHKDALGSKNYETLFGGPSGFEMDTRSGASTTLSLYMASVRGGNAFSPFNLNEWYMVTMVRNGTNEMYYINGELKKTIEAKSMPSGQYRIGAWASDTGQNYYGDMSDFRIYATALTPEQIKELYNTSMSIDDKGNIHARELVE